MMSKLRVGLTGLGNFGKLQCSILASLPNVEIVALCTRTPSKLEYFGERYNVKNLYTDHGEMVKRDDLEAVFIVSDEKLHFTQALQAIEAGKHVFLEKPMALTYREAKIIAESASNSGVYLQVGYVLRYETRHAVLKREIDAGRMGDIVYMTLKRMCPRRSFESHAHRVHPVYWTGTHDIDLAHWFMSSMVKSVYAWHSHALGYENPESMVAMLKFNNGRIATIETGWILPDGAPSTETSDFPRRVTISTSLEVVATRGYANIRQPGSDFAIWSDEGTANPEMALWPEVNGRVGGALRTQLEDFVECVLQGKESSIASVSDSVYAMKIADAIVKSATEEKEIEIEMET
jgi:predicted dehydrogenase